MVLVYDKMVVYLELVVEACIFFFFAKCDCTDNDKCFEAVQLQLAR